MRWSVFVIALAACQAKSERAADERPSTGGGPGAVHGGSSTGAPEAPRGGPTEVPKVQGIKGEPRREEPRMDPVPATPTAAKPTDEIQPATAPATSEAPSALQFGFESGGGRPAGPSKPLPAGTLGFTRLEALDVSTLDAAGAGQKIKGAYQFVLKRCYLELLAKNPTAKGTAKLAFTVGIDGRVTAPAATSFTPALDACLAERAATWRFVVPTDPRTKKPTPVRFAVELVFQPG